MQSITIKGSKRESVGKKATKALRNADKVPCVIYGEGEPVHFSADQATFKPLVYTPNVYITKIELENGDTYETFMNDLQFHPVTDSLLHVDFYQLGEGKELTLFIPVKLEGVSKGVKNGGSLMFSQRKLSITALPKDIPDYFLINITDLDISDSFLIKDFDIENVTFNQSEDMVVCRVAAPKKEVVVIEDDDEEGEEGEEGAAAEGAENEGDAPQE